MGGHIGMSHHTVAAIIVATQVINQLQPLVSRKVDLLQLAVLTVGTFHADQTDNIIADTVTFTGTIRTLDSDLRAVRLPPQNLVNARELGGSRAARKSPIGEC